MSSTKDEKVVSLVAGYISSQRLLLLSKSKNQTLCIIPDDIIWIVYAHCGRRKIKSMQSSIL